MLRLSNAFFNRAILSLQTGGRVGFASDPLINPNNLKIEGWFAQSQLEKGEFILPVGEVRDFITKGIVVNDYTALTHPSDLIRLKQIVDIRFALLGKLVVTELGNRVGKVIDFAADDDFIIQKLYINPSLLKGLTNDQIMIDRQSILEINDKRITVRDPYEKVGAGAAVTANA
jgi:sporulation protein YlmC with PRC-barrel domain